MKTREEAIDELRVINNNLSLLRRERKALIDFIEEENNRIKQISNNRTKAYELKKDKKFIEEHGRERTAKEISRLMNYSERQVQRFLEEKKD